MQSELKAMKKQRKNVHKKYAQPSALEVEQDYDFPGWGQYLLLTPGSEELASFEPTPNAHLLSEWFATSIAGNDITSSCFYVTGLVVSEAGVYAPIPLFIVVLTLYFFRFVYGESVTALPLNGGAYNVLLNTTTKKTAAVAACLTILSYVATAVVSATEAIEYLRHVTTFVSVEVGTIALLLFFCLLSLFGMTESSRVALFIFTLHMATMATLIIAALIYVIKEDPKLDQLDHNYHFTHYEWKLPPAKAIFLGFAAAMLGVSGFESSANYVEEQAPGVFVKTLRNMWIISSIINPAICCLGVSVLSITEIKTNYSTVLALIARKATYGSHIKPDWLETAVCVDAFLVLSGSVLTSYVGVTGLCRRLAMDRCMPEVLLSINSWKKTNHWIILSFFGITTSMYVMLNGEVNSLANVYTISFLGVMGLFAVGNMLLKYKRPLISREVVSPWLFTFAAFLLVITAIVGTLLKDLSILTVFSLYIVVVGGLFSTVFARLTVSRIVFFFARKVMGYSSCHVSQGYKVTTDGVDGTTMMLTPHGDNNLKSPLLAATLNVHHLSHKETENYGTIVPVVAVSSVKDLANKTMEPHQGSMTAINIVHGVQKDFATQSSLVTLNAKQPGGSVTSVSVVAPSTVISTKSQPIDGLATIATDAKDANSIQSESKNSSTSSTSSTTALLSSSSVTHNIVSVIPKSDAGPGIIELLDVNVHVEDCWHKSKFLTSFGDFIKSLKDVNMAFFSKRGALSVMNKAILYVRENEDCNWLSIIHCTGDDENNEVPNRIAQNIALLDEMYPKIRIDLVIIRAKFSPAIIPFVANELNINPNFMFITSPRDLKHKLDLLGGVRLITH